MTTDGFTTCLWFDGEAEAAAHYYVSVFKNSSVGKVTRYTEAGPGTPGSVLTVDFTANGQKFVALNGGPEFKFNEAVSIHVLCDSQEEIDELWEKLTADGGEEGPCGWLKDKYGLSWQIDSRELVDMITGPDQEAATRATKALYAMKKLDVQALREAYAG